MLEHEERRVPRFEESPKQADRESGSLMREGKVYAAVDLPEGAGKTERIVGMPPMLGVGYGPTNPEAPLDSHLDLMVDIETLGRKAGCVVLSAAGVWFDRYDAKQFLAFDFNLSIVESLDAGLTIDPETAKWWFEQDYKAFRDMAHRMEVCMDRRAAKDVVEEALKRAKRVWSCGPDFDATILTAALDLDWPFWKNRDVRTMRDLLHKEEVEEIEKRSGLLHSPVEDARRQASVVVAAYVKIGYTKVEER